MISGRHSGSGKFSYHRRDSGNDSVTVVQMPEDFFRVRIIFKHNEENVGPVLKFSEREAQILWSALSGMAKDFNWKDME